MNARVARLQRLIAVRRTAEAIDRTALERAVDAVAEVSYAMEMQKSALADARDAERIALVSGNRGEWLMADAQGEVAGWNAVGLGTLLHVRESEIAPAQEQFMKSRLDHEQVKILLAQAQHLARVEEDRRAQAQTDDWFSSKRMRAMRTR